MECCVLEHHDLRIHSRDGKLFVGRPQYLSLIRELMPVHLRPPLSSNRLWAVTSTVGAGVCCLVLLCAVVVSQHKPSRHHLDRVSFRIVMYALAAKYVFCCYVLAAMITRTVVVWCSASQVLWEENYRVPVGDADFLSSCYRFAHLTCIPRPSFRVFIRPSRYLSSSQAACCL